ncbi:hypothetical protein ABPG72_002076 [Tetrahymena utriculariae]
MVIQPRSKLLFRLQTIYHIKIHKFSLLHNEFTKSEDIKQNILSLFQHLASQLPTYQPAYQSCHILFFELYFTKNSLNTDLFDIRQYHHHNSKAQKQIQSQRRFILRSQLQFESNLDHRLKISCLAKTISLSGEQQPLWRKYKWQIIFADDGEWNQGEKIKILKEKLHIIIVNQLKIK